MKRHRRSCACILFVAAVLCVLPAQAHAQTRLTSASSVRLRVAPDTAAAVVARLPLGTPVHQIGASPDSAWIRVRTAAAGEGWLSTALTCEAPDDRRDRVAIGIIHSRLARDGDGFDSRAELLAFTERLLAADPSPELAARLALYRLRALQAAAASIHLERTWSDALVAWVVAREDELAYNEPTGEWLLRRDVILAEHDRFRDSRAADPIAWLAVLNGVPGECENDLACHVARADLLEGEYLRRRPDGAHVEEAVERLYHRLAPLRAPAELTFDPAEDCADLNPMLRSLRGAVNGVATERRGEVLAILNELGARCGRREG